ncbi:AraC family transcriptional regulator [Tahibacter amnicola]|uniref:AraC family transcriptional regulator n=1 Tax=Tahibacter amnicola TaxID=2976241 RepID=A0ABY6BD31_9GAMM|nr:AraC family transcriptional regulator [Tahibacter amnicola]UXI65817.1 AraC family transcriptional regulator [Tahibacter amnicola]
MLDPRTVSNPYVRTLLGVIQARGVDLSALHARLPIDPAMLDDPNGRIAPEIVHRIWEHGLALTGDPLLGLAVAEAAQPATFRALGLAAMTCASLQDAMALMLRYYRLVSESGVLTAQAESNGDAAIVYTEQLARLRLFPQQVEAIVGGILVMGRRLADRPLVPTAVAFRHPAQGEHTAYRRFFGCEVQFDAPANLFRLPAAELGRRLPHSDPDLHRVHCELLDRQLASLPQVGSLTAFTKQWLAARVSGAMRVEDLARAMGMSVRALQRQLQQEGATWTTLVDAARQDALKALLRQGVSLDEAARQMGYHDASSLSRAARRWLGTAPGQWRESDK